MGGSSKTETTSQTRNPWEPAQAGLQDILSKAQTQGNDASIWTPTYSGNTTAGLGQLGQVAGLPSFGASTIRNTVGQTQQGGQIGQDQLQQTASGGYLNANQYLDPVIQRSLEDTANQVNAQFSGAGRYGSGAQTDALTRQLGGLEMNARLGNYNTERSNQLNAAGQLNQSGLAGAQMSTAVDPAEAQKAALLMQTGQTQDQMDQATRMAGVNATNWQAGLTAPIANLGGTSNGTSTTQNTPSLGSQIAGGAMMGLGLLTGNPMAMMGGMGGMMGGGGGVYQPASSIARPGELPWR